MSFAVGGSDEQDPSYGIPRDPAYGTRLPCSS
jgi:hypothetical protein